MRPRLVGAAILVGTLAACGRVGPPVAPQLREPQPATELTAEPGEAVIDVSWANPTRRMDNSPLRDLALVRVFRAEDSGEGEPRIALRSRGQIGGYEEIATVRLSAPAPATIEGGRVHLADRQGLIYGRRYTYVLLVEDAQGRVSPPSARRPALYIAAPAPPRDLEAVAGEGEVRLRWAPPTQLVDGSAARGTITYEVARSPAGEAAWQTVTGAPVADTALTDRGVVNDRTYAYTVRAVRTEGGGRARGTPSEPVTASPHDLTPPAPPRDLVAVVAGGDVRLAWAPSGDPDVARYVIYRTDQRGATTRAGSVAPPVTTFVDPAVPPGAYRYVVAAQDGSARANESAHSAAASAVVP